jgi:uncharacterized protein with HEPN domain
MDKNISIITHIIKHIENVLSSQKRFGNDYKVFISDRDYFNSVCMSLLQIGELANHLTAEFISGHSDIPWESIIGLRNVVVHGYGQLDMEIVWATITDDIPDLYEKCKALLSGCAG